MLSDEFGELLRPLVRIQRVIWFALMISIPVYIGVAYVVTSDKERTLLVNRTVETVLYTVSLATAIGSVVYRQRTFSDTHLQNRLKEEVDPRQLATNAQTGEVDSERLRQIEALTPIEQKILGLVASLQTANIINLALNESIAICGLLLVFLSGNFSILVPFVLATVALNLLMFPRPRSLVERARHSTS